MPWLLAQVIGVLDAMPSATLKPDEEGVVLEANRTYRTTYMFSATMPPAVERLAKKYLRRPVVRAGCVCVRSVPCMQWAVSVSDWGSLLPSLLTGCGHWQCWQGHRQRDSEGLHGQGEREEQAVSTGRPSCTSQ